MKTNKLYHRHILDAILQVGSYAAEIDRDAFEVDRMRQDAVVRQIEIIGEASRNSRKRFVTSTIRFPWPDIIGM